MKFHTVVPAILFAASSSLPFAAYAADTDKAATETMKPHSHVEEKMGVGMASKAKTKAPAATPEENPRNAEKPKAEGKKDKHSHPRDGK